MIFYKFLTALYYHLLLSLWVDLFQFSDCFFYFIYLFIFQRLFFEYLLCTNDLVPEETAQIGKKLVLVKDGKRCDE